MNIATSKLSSLFVNVLVYYLLNFILIEEFSQKGFSKLKHFFFENDTNSEKYVLLDKTETLADDVFEKTETLAKNGCDKAETMTRHCYGKAESVFKDNLVKTQSIAKNAYEKMETVVEDARENAVNTMMEMEHKANVGKLVEENGTNHLEIETSKQNVQENRQNRIKVFVSNFFDKHLSSEETKEAFICSNCSGKSKTEEIVKTRWTFFRS